MINFPLAFVLVAAVGYFSSSVFKTVSTNAAAPKMKFDAITSALEAMASSSSSQYVSKKGVGFLIWPKGTIDAVSYSGAFATYITPILSGHSFQVTTYAYVRAGDQRPSWKRMENFTSTAVEFELKLRSVVALPPSARSKLIGTHSAGTAEKPTQPPIK